MTAPTTRHPVRFARLALALALAAGACTAGGNAASPSPASGSPGSGGPLAAASPAVRLVIAQASATLAAPVQREIAVTDGRTIYLAGGLDAADRSADGVFALDPLSGTLTYLGSLPQPFHDGAGALISGRLFVFGGGSTRGTDIVQAFDLRTGRGAVVGHLPVALSDLSAATIGGTTYLVGGWDGAAPSATIYATTDGRHFTQAGQLPEGLRYPAVTVVGGELVVAGGESRAGTPVATVTVLDTGTGLVRPGPSLPDLPAPVAHAAAFALGGVVYVAGGRDAGGNAVTTVTAIDPAAGTTTAVAPLRRPLSDSGTTASGNQAWLIGGWRGRAVGQVLEANLEQVTPTPPAASPVSPSPSASPSVDAASVRPFAGKLLVADRGNNRLLVLNANGHVIWTYPSATMPTPTLPFYYPDDAFWVHGGNAILVNEEDNNVLAEIAYPSGKTLWTYGHPKVAGSSTGYVHQPDDLYPYPGGGMVVADASNCRILFFDARGRPTRQIGQTGNCTPGLPATVGYPNGDTPLPNGHLLVTELHAGSISEITSTGHPVWTVRIPNLSVPSDPQRLPDGSYLAADYQSPGAVVRFTSTGKVLWTYRPTSGPAMLDHPSLAAMLPNGLIAITDDFNHRIVLIDPKNGRTVWQYGHTNVPGTGHGYLNAPDGLDLLLPGNLIPLHLDFASDRVRPGRP